MTPERWRRLRAVLEPALELAPGDVGDWLDTHCDAELRAEVDKLLAAARHQDTVLDRPVLRADGVLEAGTTIGPYVIEELIGVGGMGVVYRARDQRLGRPVAVKLLTFGGRARDLLREARAASALSHPNIVVVLDVLVYRDTPAIVMEHVEGRTLAEVLADGPLPAPVAAGYAWQIAEAVAAAHEAAVLHRDLKPANVMVRRDGVVKVLDFGIARPLPGRGQVAARAAGTSGYAAPEQIAGGALDARADVYSFGATLRAMLGAAADAPPWRSCIERCLAAEPAARYDSMRQVADALRGAARGRRTAWWAAAAVVVLALVATLALALRAPGADPPPPAFATAALPGAAEPRSFPHISPDGTAVVFSALVEGRRRLFVQRIDAVSAGPLGQEGRHAAFSPDGGSLVFRSERDGGGLFLLDLDGGNVRRLTSEGFHPAWSPDGSAVAFSSEGFERPEERPTSASVVRVVEVASGSVRPLTDRGVIGDAIQPAWSPDGRRIAFWSVDAGRRRLWSVAAAGGLPVAVTDGTSLDWSPAWSADGWLYFSSDRSGAMGAWRVRIDADTGRPLGAPQAIPLPSRYAAWFSFARDGRMAFSDQAPASSVWRARIDGTGEAERLTPRTLRLSYPTVSPDGEWLVAFEETPNDRLALLRNDGSDFRYLTSRGGRDRGPAWAPNGETIAFVSSRDGDYAIWQVAPDGTGLRRLVGADGGAFSPVWAPGGGRLAWFAAGFVPMVYSFADDSSVAVPLPPDAPGLRPTDWSPDGARIAGLLRDEDGERLGAAVLDLGAGRYVRLPTYCEWLRWMPDGRRVACVNGARLTLIDVAGVGVTPALTLPYPVDNQFDIGPDGVWIYAALSENLSEIWTAAPVSAPPR